MTGATGRAVMAASRTGDPGNRGGREDRLPGTRVRVVRGLGEIAPKFVSEGGLEPPCPLRALAPQASASAYSATRTRDARGTHRLSYLSKPNALRRVPRPVNLAARCRSPPSVRPAPDPGSSPLRQPLTGTWHPHRRPVQHGCRAHVVPARCHLAQVD